MLFLVVQNCSLAISVSTFQVEFAPSLGLVEVVTLVHLTAVHLTLLTDAMNAERGDITHMIVGVVDVAVSDHGQGIEAGADVDLTRGTDLGLQDLGPGLGHKLEG